VCRGGKVGQTTTGLSAIAMEQIADWLRKLGLSEYTELFVKNGIDIDVLSELTDQGLEKLGVLLGHRRRMLRAIRDLGEASVAATPSSTPTPTRPTRRDDAERRQLTVMFCDLVGSTPPGSIRRIY
jgi:SAM domain (Sterile alpha motif)